MLDSISSLNIGIITRSNGPHGCGLIARIGLSGVLEIGVGSSRTVDADVACGCDVRTSMGLAHDSDDCDSTGCSDRLCLQEWSQFVFIVVGNSTDDLDEFGGFGYSILLGDLMDERIEDDLLSLFIALNEFGDDFRDVLEEEHIFVYFVLRLFVGFVGGGVLNHINTYNFLLYK